MADQKKKIDEIRRNHLDFRAQNNRLLEDVGIKSNKILHLGRFSIARVGPIKNSA